MKENPLIDILQQVKEVLDYHSIEFWLDCGTLLGAVRDGKFIPWEQDIDLGSWREKVPETVKISVSKNLCDRGFKVWIAENFMNIKKNEFCADLKFYRLSDDKAIEPKLAPKNLLGRFLDYFLYLLSAPYHYEVDKAKSLTKRVIIRILISISRKMPSLLRKPITQILSVVYEKIGSEDVSEVIPLGYFRDLSTIKFYDTEFRVPARTKEYLAYRYGEDWQIPKKDWITARDDGAAISSNRRKKGYHES